jgi:SAM-dependent methyltransferase
MYYGGKRDVLSDIWGAPVTVEPGRLTVAGTSYPIIDDVTILLDPAEYPLSLRAKSVSGRPGHTRTGIAQDVQASFGAEWQRFPRILPEHEREFAMYFDLVDLGTLKNRRVCDLGCGNGRWSYFLRHLCRELVLVDFSEAIFIARENLRDAPNALFFMADIMRLPFRPGFADLAVCLGVLHHLPMNALDAARLLKGYAPELLVYLYYALDNRPSYFRTLLVPVTAARRFLSRLQAPAAREFLTWAIALGVYLPLIGLGHALRPLGAARWVPLYEVYAGKSLLRIRQDVYDRFFTSIEQRFTREEILTLRDTFREVIISDGPPYWHFLCRS